MSPAWVEILGGVVLTIASIGGNWFLIKWRVKALEHDRREDHKRIERLEKHFAAYTGVVNGVKYRGES